MTRSHSCWPRQGSGYALALLAGLIWSACGAPESTDLASPPTGKPTQAPALRVVSLSPIASRFVLLLGAERRLVGVDSASAHLPGLEAMPAVDLAGAVALAPDLLLAAARPAPDTPEARKLADRGIDLVEFAPRDLEDVYALFREVGSRLVGRAEALKREVELARPLGTIGGASFGQRRLRTLAVTGFEPIAFAGAHSFETDLIELAGAHSLTHAHGGEAERIAATPDRLAAYAPELILVITPAAVTAAQRQAVTAELADFEPIEFLTFNARTFWLDDPTAVAGLVRKVIVKRTPLSNPGAL